MCPYNLNKVQIIYMGCTHLNMGWDFIVGYLIPSLLRYKYEYNDKPMCI